jgi:hypothetical protein
MNEAVAAAAHPPPVVAPSGPSGFDVDLFAGLTDVLILQEFECCICAGVQLDVKTATACQHSFCGGCIDKWLSEHDTCPLCRAPTPGPGDCNAVRPNANAQRFLDSLPVRCTEVVADEQGGSPHRCGWLGVLGPRGDIWRQHVVSAHGCADPIDKMVYVPAAAPIEPAPEQLDVAALLRALGAFAREVRRDQPRPQEMAEDRRARWAALHAERLADLPVWRWATPADDVISLADLERLLADEAHPAHLSLARANAEGPRMAYIHVWNERTQCFMRGCQFQMRDMRTLGGLQYQKPFREWSAALVLEEAAHMRVMGPNGCLVKWMARQLAVDYRLFFPMASAAIDGMSLEARTTYFLDACALQVQAAQAAECAAANSARAAPPPILRLKIQTNRVLGDLPEVEVFRLRDANDLDPSCVYAALRQHPGEADDAFRARVIAEHFDDPHGLVQPHTRNHYAWALMGAVIMAKDRWSLVTRCQQIVLSPPRLMPAFRMLRAPPAAAAAGAPDCKRPRLK